MGHSTATMSKTILIRIYKMFKKKPTKCFILSDFHLGKGYRYYVTTLVQLGLVEKCDVIYRMGVKRMGYRNAKGYRLKRRSS
jgi:hypothetical protein